MRGPAVRWDAMFADLESQADALETAQRAGEVDDRARAELAGLGLADRLRAAIGSPVRLRTLGGAEHSGALTRVGAGWALLDPGAGRETVVRLDAVVRVDGLGRSAAVPGSAGRVEGRLGVGSVLRRIARDRAPVRVHLTDGTTLHATIDRVGADFADLAVHAPGEPRRAAAVQGVPAIPFAAVAAVARTGSGSVVSARDT